MEDLATQRSNWSKDIKDILRSEGQRLSFVDIFSCLLCASFSAEKTLFGIGTGKCSGAVMKRIAKMVTFTSNKL